VTLGWEPGQGSSYGRRPLSRLDDSEYSVDLADSPLGITSFSISSIISDIPDPKRGSHKLLPGSLITFDAKLCAYHIFQEQQSKKSYSTEVLASMKSRASPQSHNPLYSWVYSRRRRLPKETTLMSGDKQFPIQAGLRVHYVSAAPGPALKKPGGQIWESRPLFAEYQK